jgi:hypothetical protein
MTPRQEALLIAVRHEVRVRKWRRRFQREVVKLAREIIRLNRGTYDLTTHRLLMSRIDRVMERYYALHPDDLRGYLMTDVIVKDARFIAPLAPRRLKDGAVLPR